MKEALLTSAAMPAAIEPTIGGHAVVTAAETASFLRVTPRHVQKLAATDKLPAIDGIGRHLRFRARDVLAFAGLLDLAVAS